ncbi:hypothetical protein KAR50_07690 [Periweissella fabaria]|uniref:Uncharacterized protein n=1 Tax=Periweissella fabaria TaxID=546157 RepID=A0ABM8Z7F8_9LACO|nr:hypothetical protein [Periweissella fabaria]MCM0597718.1 hypothetical protein [Periweissella fabaria]CAH0417167.1 hypothetical protein WFA24289_01496 [Periweissella fabaria]
MNNIITMIEQDPLNKEVTTWWIKQLCFNVTIANEFLTVILNKEEKEIHPFLLLHQFDDWVTYGLTSLDNYILHDFDKYKLNSYVFISTVQEYIELAKVKLVVVSGDD